MTVPGAWTRWVDRVAATESATSIALFRIGIGLGALLTIGSVASRGLVPVLWVDRALGGYRALGDGPWLVSALGGPNPTVVWGLVAVALVGAALLTLGIGGRVVAFATLVACTNLVSINAHAGGSYDDLLTNGLWLAVLGGGEATLSVTARIRTGAWWPPAEVLAFPRWLTAWQLVLMYHTTGLQKVSAYWVPGGDASALYYILQQPEWHRRDMSALAYVFPLTQLATTVTWLWEVTAPVWLLATWYGATRDRPGWLRAWSNRLHLRTVYAAIGIGMHVVIWATMEVGPFSPLSLAFYVAMVHPEEWERLAARWLPARLRPGLPADGAVSPAG
ncbi:MAG: hypothetical protein ABMB14_13640 [Myxococcota bacterium]